VFDGLETNISDFEINEFYWFLGDGSDVKRGLNISHKFEKAGIYTVKLGVTSLMDERTRIKKACGSKRIIVIQR
jgi:PKD repeat protein